MAKDPADRYQTAEDLGYDLSRIQETLKHELHDECKRAFMAWLASTVEEAFAHQGFNPYSRPSCCMPDSSS